MDLTNFSHKILAESRQGHVSCVHGQFAFHFAILWVFGVNWSRSAFWLAPFHFISLGTVRPSKHTLKCYFWPLAATTLHLQRTLYKWLKMRSKMHSLTYIQACLKKTFKATSEFFKELINSFPAKMNIEKPTCNNKPLGSGFCHRNHEPSGQIGGKEGRQTK